MLEIIILIVAMAALCCMATMTVLACMVILQKREKPAAPRELTDEEKELQKLELEQQRLQLQGLKDMFSWDGFGKMGGRKL